MTIPGSHLSRHPQFVEGCAPCRWQSIRINTSADVADIDRRERILSADMAAYKRLRGEGLQPHQLDGSAELEKRALDPVEIELNTTLPKEFVPRIKEAMNAEALKQWGGAVNG